MKCALRPVFKVFLIQKLETQSRPDFFGALCIDCVYHYASPYSEGGIKQYRDPSVRPSVCLSHGAAA